MSVKPEDFLIYVCELLNIKTESKFTLAEMMEDIKSIYHEDLPKFKNYIKTNFADEKYEYMNGPQKFTKIIQDFEYWNRPRLSEASRKKVENYSSYLFKKTCKVFDLINWEIESKGYSIEQVNIRKIHSGNKPFYSEADLEYLLKIGDVADIYNLVKRNKPKLEAEILKIVTVNTLIKYDPRNQIESKIKDKKVIEQLERRSA